MAEAVAGAISYFATGTYVYGAAAYMGYAYVVVAASAIAYSGYASRKAEARARAAANASAKDREVMIRSAIAPRRIVYGRDRISGPIVYMESTGDKSQYLHMVVALAAHECDAIETVYFNEVALPDADGDGWITSGEYAKGSSTQADTHTGTTNGSGQLTLPRNAESITAAYTEIGVGEAATQTHHTGYSHTAGSNTITGLPADTSVTIGYTYTQAATPLVRVRKYLGTADQTACADLVAESDGKWTTDHRGRGICYLYVRLEYDQDVFGSTGVPNISAVVRGKKIYDPRTTTTAWSNNAALCVADYLRSDEGMRADSAEVPDSEIIAAANICDEEVDLSLDDEDVQARYTCDMSFTSERSPRDVLAELLACMSGRAVWTQGRWLVRPGAYRTPTLTITADMLAGPVSVMPKASRSELFNAVRATYRDATSFAELQAPLVENSGYEAEDGGVQIVRQIDVPTLADTYRAQRLAKIELERGRQAVTVKLQCNLKAYDLAPSDTVLLTLATYGWTAKAFEVLERTLTREGTIQYTLRETAAGVYDWAWGEATVGDLAPDTNLPNPFGLPAVLQNLAVDEDAIRLADGTIITQAVVTWDASESPFVANGGSIQYQTAKVGTPWGTGSLPGDATTVTLGPLQVGVAYVFRARAINATGRAGDWAYIGLVAEGLAAPPDDVTGLDYEIKPGQVWITWDPCTEADYAATELRYDGTGWDDATFLWRGAGSDYQHPRPPNGTYTVRAKHIDTSGTYSVNQATISVTVDDSLDPASAKLLQLVVTGFAFIAADAAATTVSGPNIAFTATLQNLTGTATFTATAYNAADASLGTITLGGSGNVRTLTAAQFTNSGTWATRYVKVEAALSGLTDTATVYRGDSGSAAVQAMLTNEAHTLPSAADGSGVTYTGSGSNIRVFEGVTELDFDGIGTAAGKWTATRAATSGTITPGAITESGLQAVMAQHSGMTTTTAQVTVTITGKTSTGAAFSLTKIQTLTKSLAGATGANGTRTARLRMYRWSASTPVTFPSGTSTYTWATGAFTAPATLNSWTLTPGAAVAGQTLWACEQAYSDNLTDATSVVTWSTSTAFAAGAAGTDGGTGQTGQSNHRVYRAATIGVPPSTPGNTVSGATPAGWSATPVTLTTGQEQYQSDGTTPAGSTTTTWSTPYPSYLKVGDLSAISANLGTVTAGNLNTSGFVKVEGVNAAISLFDEDAGVAQNKTVAIIANTSLSAAIGVYGKSADTAGLYGESSGTGTNDAGVYGRGKNGVIGRSTGVGAGVRGSSSASSGSYGVYGVSGGSGTHGVYAAQGLAGGTALTVAGGLSISGQITSTLASGTAPFSITSNTLVTNLNADLLKGKTWATPDPIGSTTANTGAFTTLSTTGNAQVASLRINQGSSAGSAQWNLPNGGSTASGKPGSNSTAVFVPVNMNGVDGWILWWPN